MGAPAMWLTISINSLSEHSVPPATLATNPPGTSAAGGGQIGVDDVRHKGEVADL
jgi:hypothetical protein